MAFQQDKGMPPLVACNVLGNAGESRNARRKVRGPLLWETMFIFPEREEQGNELEQVNDGDEEEHQNVVEEDQHQHQNYETSAHIDASCWLETLRSLDQLCEETQFEGSSLGHAFSLDGLPEALICLHRKGLFDLSPGAVTHVLHIACIICLDCIILMLRTESHDNKDVASLYARFGLSGEVSRLSDKWSWRRDSCQNTFNEWIRYDPGTEKVEATKLLYQWTLLPLLAVISKVESAMDDANASGDQYIAEVELMSKWGDELCDFLEIYRSLFQASDDTEFLYVEMYKFHRRTALLHRNLGNSNRATKLLETLKDMLGGIEEFDLMVTKWDSKGEIAYLKPDPVTITWQKGQVWTLLRDQGCRDADEFLDKIYQEQKDIINRQGWVYVKCGYLRTSDFGYEIDKIISYIGLQRFSEAREIFEQLDLQEKRLSASFREFLEIVITYRQNFITHFCGKSTAKWEAILEKLDFLVDVCEALGDRQLTAKFLHQYGIIIGDRALKKFADCMQDPPTLRLLLQEELNLQISSPFPVCIQELISCLSGACEADEHKRNSFPDTLKTYRLFKRSIDIYSDLLHKWTQGSSNEVGWLKLLESQKSVHSSMLLYLILMGVLYCSKGCMVSERKDSSVSVDDELCSSPSALGSDHSITVVRHALNAFKDATLVWVERGRARTLLSQLGPWYNTKQEDGSNLGSLKEELIEFHNDHQAAWSSILSCRLACRGEPLFVEYVSQSSMNNMAFLIHKRHGLVLSARSYGKADEVEELVDDFYKTVPLQRNNSDGDVVAKLHGILEILYDILIEPLSGDARFTHLDPKSTLVFVPDKMLYRVPFALLRDKKTRKHLFELHPIAISPSLRVLQHCERRLRDLENFPLKPEGCILAVGNAAYESNRLPGTAKELEHLRSCFPGRVETLEEDEATRAKFLELVEEACHSKEGHVFACIHLGVHGHWRKIKPRDDEEDNQYKTGSLQFAKGPQHSTKGSKGHSTDTSRGDLSTSQSSVAELEFRSKAEISSFDERHESAFGEVGAVTRAADFKTTAAENMLPSEDIVKSGVQWRTRLVVLSACNSSRGQDYSDGEVNLPRALMIAGVPAAVVSQWKIDDSASPMLMKAFYEHLQSGQDVAMALQSAMLQLSNPESDSADKIFEWGPFLVWGLPSVQLPVELWTETARKTFPARKLAELLRCKFDRLVDGKLKVDLLESHLKSIVTFLESASGDEVEVIVEAIIAVRQLLKTFYFHPYLPEEIFALAEEFYTRLPLNRLNMVELELVKRGAETLRIMFDLRARIMYIQAMKGSLQVALDYANKMMEVPNDGSGYDESIVQVIRENKNYFRRERAVVLRLMGNYDEALKEFVDLLTIEEDYACLIQTSYLKHLMEDTSGALEYARRARKVESHELNKPGYGVFVLGK